MNRRSVLAGSVAALSAALSGIEVALAQAFPTRPVRIVVPYPAGQGSDIFARRFADRFQAQLGQTFFVENRAGAGGNIGAAGVARAEPDGYTLLWGTNATHAGNEFLYANLGFDPVKDFAPVASIARIPMVVASARSSKLRTLTDVIAAAKAEPGKLSVGLPSNTARVALELIRDRSGVAVVPVPYNGSGQALTGLLRGDVQIVVDTVTALTGAIGSEQVTPIAVSTAQPAASLPNVPTLRTAGVDVVLDAWNALYAPRATPADVIRTLSRATAVALSDTALRDQLIRDGADPMDGTPEEVIAVMARDRGIWGPAVRSLGLAVQ